jgi:undecaprenyl pyrophosphate synthase
MCSEDTQKELAASRTNENNTTTVVTFAINYGGRDEIVRAIKENHEAVNDIVKENLPFS